MQPYSGSEAGHVSSVHIYVFDRLKRSDRRFYKSECFDKSWICKPFHRISSILGIVAADFPILMEIDAI